MKKFILIICGLISIVFGACDKSDWIFSSGGILCPANYFDEISRDICYGGPNRRGWYLYEPIYHKDVKLDKYRQKAKQCEKEGSEHSIMLAIKYYEIVNNYDKADNLKQSQIERCNKNNASACFYIALRLWEQCPFPRDCNPHNMLTYYTKACKLKSAAACENIGYRLEDNRSSFYNPIKSQEYFKKACNLGNDVACLKIKPASKDKQEVDLDLRVRTR